MKLLIILISITLINNGCQQTHVQQENFSIEYSSSTRGAFQQIIVNNKTIAVTRNRDGDLITKTCSDKEWYNIIELFKKINIENLPNIEPPSKNHQFDGAAAAILLITKNNKAYESPTFDHGNPPKKIASLVKEILSIAENIE